MKALSIWQKLSTTAFGRWLFSRLVCFKIPYFNSIKPVFEILEPGRAVARMRKRRSVLNHFGTVHAIAMANLCEFVGGTLTEISTPPSMRWVARSMQIDFLHPATSNVRATATISDIVLGETQDIIVPVELVDNEGTVAVRADITMYLTPRPTKG